MKFCSHCGTQIDDNAVICLKCGCSTAPNSLFPYGTNLQDAPSAGFAILSFFFPIIGLILWLVWKDYIPMRAKSCGKGALVGAITALVIIIATIVTVVVINASAEAIINGSGITNGTGITTPKK